MLERRRARRTWALGLIVILCSYNLAYANVKVSKNTDVPPAKVRTTKLNDDGATKTIKPDTRTKTVPASNKKVSTVNYSATAANSCACNCETKVGRATPAPGRWWDCMKGCLRSWGVSVVQIALCGASCAIGIIPLCAICLAIDASLFMLCANGCAVYSSHVDTPEEGYEIILVKKLPRDKRHKADRRVQAFAARK